MHEFKISNDKILRDVVGKIAEFPKYTTQLINLANQNAGGTRPRVVGQMSELIKEFPQKELLGILTRCQVPLRKQLRKFIR